MSHRLARAPGVALALASVLAAAALAAPEAAAQPAVDENLASVVLDRVVRGPVRETVPVYGRLVSRRTGVVAARGEGAVAEVRVEVGDRVEAGAVLVKLVGDTLEAKRALKAAELEEFRARVTTARSQLALARQELRRLERLRRSAAFSQARFNDKTREVERFRSVLAETEAKVKQAAAELEMADIALSRVDLKAPYGGVVSKRHTELGAYLDVGDPVVTLIDDEALEVEAEVPAVRVAGLAPGTSVGAAFDDGTTFTAMVRAIVPEENPLARTRTVRLVPVLPDAARQPAVNQSVLLSVPSGPPRTIVSVHKDAIVRRDGQTIVYGVVDGLAKMHPIRIGAAVGERFEVIEGLAPGEMVVVRGNERLRPGQPVRVRAAGGPS